jgi:hypothetical protein
MKTIYDEAVRAELIDRINNITLDRTAQWGKMNLYQMVKHCSNWDEWIQGKNNPVYKQEFIGWLFGKLALKGMVKDDRPLKKGMPSGAAFEVREKEGDIELTRQKWAGLIADYAHYSNPGFIHDFFGKMTVEQIGILAYKHNDHHLRQFGC